ncbi:universal stress protein [Burkholderia multivorans]|uniref:universal stress protein n=2 Tax=Burkholderia multivorans TaxID=87883 RepID=UPI0020A24B8C|nr:universal stress protein [Burkholderia multivorans]MCO8590652.1 universal stress protein [Burkholderia multivorans]
MSASASATEAHYAHRRVLIAIDVSAASERALAYAERMLHANAFVHLVSIAENPRTLVPLGSHAMSFLHAARNELLKDAADCLSRAQRTMTRRTDIVVSTEVVDLSAHGGDIVDALTDRAQTWQADLAIVGTRQHHGVRRWIEGAVSGPLAARIGCPLLIVPEGFVPNADALPRRILFAVDGSGPALDALRVGLQFATPGAELRALYVVDRAVSLGDFVPIDTVERALNAEGDTALREATAMLVAIGAHAHSHLTQTDQTAPDVPHAIVREAVEWHADLTVMGTHGRRGIAGWALGSVAERVARITNTPLLLVNANPA